MNRESRKSRHYAVSPLPTVNVGIDPPNRDVLLALYTQVCTTWRELIEIRFKLLALVPAVSVLSQAAILSNSIVGAGLGRPLKAGLCVFGLLVTFGLFLYDKRNSELHDDLISRGRKIEDELGIDTGQFKGRLRPSNSLVKHDVALAIIYGTSLVGWAMAVVVPIKPGWFQV